MRKKRLDLEHQEQAALFEWANTQFRRYPELALMYATPNGGHRHVLIAVKLKAEGVKAGVPDIFLPVPRRKYHGLYIELKVGRNRPTAKQKWWLEQLAKQGYAIAVCYGWEEARSVIEAYLNGGIK